MAMKEMAVKAIFFRPDQLNKGLFVGFFSLGKGLVFT